MLMEVASNNNDSIKKWQLFLVIFGILLIIISGLYENAKLIQKKETEAPPPSLQEISQIISIRSGSSEGPRK